jgi:hypothetical protein
MSGVILAFLLSTQLIGSPDWTEAAMTGGYHLGPAYATVTVATRMETITPLWNYRPMDVLWDFRLGVHFEGFDASLSRYCRHDVFGGSEDIGGLRLLLSWSNWP